VLPLTACDPKQGIARVEKDTVTQMKEKPS